MGSEEDKERCKKRKMKEEVTVKIGDEYINRGKMKEKQAEKNERIFDSER